MIFFVFCFNSFLKKMTIKYWGRGGKPYTVLRTRHYVSLNANDEHVDVAKRILQLYEFLCKYFKLLTCFWV